MPNYFGKQRLVRILYNYLEWTAPEKLAELKRELKEAGEYRKYEIKYTKRRGDEWLKAHIYFDRIEYRFEMHAWGKESKRVTLIEKKVIGDYDDESITQTFAGTAHYDQNFNPMDTDTSHCSDLLVLQSIAKVGQASEQHKDGEQDEKKQKAHKSRNSTQVRNNHDVRIDSLHAGERFRKCRTHIQQRGWRGGVRSSAGAVVGH